MVDRIAPTSRPKLYVSGHQRWRHLLFLHWYAPIEAVRRVVPQPLELDLLHGRAVVGLVPFVMEGVREAWWPKALSLRFLEANLRTYVIHRGVPGVYFISMEAGSRLAVWGARWSWSLPYHHARISFQRRRDVFRYQSRRSRNRAALDVEYEPTEQLNKADPDSDEFFLLERYRLFVVRGGCVYEGAVHHETYPAWSVVTGRVTESLLNASGLPSANGQPAFAHYCPGVDVEIFGPRRVD